MRLKSFLLTALAVIVVLGMSTRAFADSYKTFWFNGVCTSCSGGAAKETARLSLFEYNFGDSITDPNVTFLTYGGRYIQGVFNGRGSLVDASGSLGSGPGEYDVYVHVPGTGFIFETKSDGFWCFDSACSGGPGDYGYAFTWNPYYYAAPQPPPHRNDAITDAGTVPEPASWALLATGVASLAALRRRFVRV